MSNLLNKYLAGVKKIIPDKEEGSSVGIDIGVNSCKMVEITKSGNAYKLINLVSEPIVGGDAKGTLQSVIGNAKYSTKEPFTAISGKGTLIRYINMPKMSIDDLKKSLAFEADKYFPFAKEQIYTDCYILDPKAQDNKMSVLVAAAKKELVDARIELLTSLGLQSEFIGINPIAMANVINTLGFNSEKDAKDAEEPTGSSAVAVLDMGDSVSNLLILIGNTPRFTRDIHIGGRDVSKRISNALGITEEQAEKSKLDPKDQVKEVLGASDTALTNLISELRLSFDYFSTEFNFQISKLMLTGGASGLEGCLDFFGKNLDVSVEKWNPLASLEIADDLSTEEFDKDACRYATALGLALYQYQ